MMAYFPLFVDLKNKSILIIGGGNVAYRKILKLLPFEANITIISPEICIEIDDIIKKNSKIRYIKKEIEANDLEDVFFVITATSDKKLNSSISELCRQKNIPINSVDDLSNCSFIFPAIIKKESLIIASSTSGKAPELNALLKNMIEKNLPNNIEIFLEDFSKLRKTLKEIIPEQKIRAEIIHALLEYCNENDFQIEYNKLEAKMNEYINKIM